MNQKMLNISKSVFKASIKLNLDARHSLPKKERIKSMISSLEQMLDILDKRLDATSCVKAKLSQKIK